MVGGAGWPLHVIRLLTAAGLNVADMFDVFAPAASVAFSVLLALLCLCLSIVSVYDVWTWCTRNDVRVKMRIPPVYPVLLFYDERGFSSLIFWLTGTRTFVYRHTAVFSYFQRFSWPVHRIFCIHTRTVINIIASFYRNIRKSLI